MCINNHPRQRGLYEMPVLAMSWPYPVSAAPRERCWHSHGVVSEPKADSEESVTNQGRIQDKMWLGESLFFPPSGCVSAPC